MRAVGKRGQAGTRTGGAEMGAALEDGCGGQGQMRHNDGRGRGQAVGDQTGGGENMRRGEQVAAILAASLATPKIAVAASKKAK